MKSGLVASRVFLVSFIPLLLFAIVMWKFPAIAVVRLAYLTRLSIVAEQWRNSRALAAH